MTYHRVWTTVAWLWVACGVVLAAGCDPVIVHTATNPAASFEHYRSYSFGAPEDAPRGYAVSPWPAEVRGRVQPLIAAELDRKGYALASDKGDLVIQFGSGRRVVHVDEAQVREGDQSLVQEPHFVYDVVEGSLVIDAFDATNGVRVWHGSSRAEIDPDRVDPALLRTSVAELLGSFPSAGGRKP
jgi:uncharacterized protein DUF4136